MSPTFDSGHSIESLRREGDRLYAELNEVMPRRNLTAVRRRLSPSALDLCGCREAAIVLAAYGVLMALASVQPRSLGAWTTLVFAGLLVSGMAKMLFFHRRMARWRRDCEAIRRLLHPNEPPRPFRARIGR